MLEKIKNILILILLILSCSAVFLHLQRNLIKKQVTVAKLGGIAYQSRLNIEFFNISSSDMSCIGAVTTSPDQTFATASIDCK